VGGSKTKVKNLSFALVVKVQPTAVPNARKRIGKSIKRHVPLPRSPCRQAAGHEENKENKENKEAGNAIGT
jgi:hypothetical protein